jgi:hypothetical protein
MIVNGGSRAGAQSLATHLLNAKKNERVEVLGVRGCLSTDLRGALIEMEESAEATRCQKALYHANIDPDRNVKMTAAQWQRSIDALEEKLGLQDHARAVVMHQKHGREHIHVVWNRIDLETMKTVRDSHNYRKHELVARDLEREFGHERVQGAHVERGDQPRPDRTPPKWAMQQGERLKIDPRQVKTQVQELWEASDSGRSFGAALNDHGLAIAKGDRRDFIIVDQAGGVHSLGRCVATKAAEVRARMADVDREGLLSIEQAVEAMRVRSPAERAPERGAVREEFAPAAGALLTPSPNRTESTPLPRDEVTNEIRRAYTVSISARSFENSLGEHGIRLAVVTAKEAQRNPAYMAGEIVAISSAGQVYALDRHTTGETPESVGRFLGALDRKNLQGIEATQEDLALQVAQFIALSQVGALQRPEKDEQRTSLPSDELGEQKKIDFRRYIEDRDYRREVQRRQEKEQPPPQRQRGGLER